MVFHRDLGDPDKTRRWLRSLELPQVGLIAGGFPCQPYSRAGQSIIRHLVASSRRDATDQRAFAWRTFVAAVDELGPSQAIAENVPDLARFNDGEVLRDIVESLEALGYEVDIRILLARHFGVPQFRERLFIQAARPGMGIRWPESVGDEAAVARLDFAIRDLPDVTPGEQAEPLEYVPREGTMPPAWARAGCKGHSDQYLYDHVARSVRSDDLEAFRLLEPGGTYLDIPEELRRYDDQSFTDKYKRLTWDQPGRTVTAHIARDGYSYIHPEQHRTLSIREAARLQTFPDWYGFAGFPSNRFTQIGNAVPPLLGKAVGEALLDAPDRPCRESAVPAASAVLRAQARKRPERQAWSTIVAECALGGRASGKRLAETLMKFPSAADVLAADVSDSPESKRLAAVARIFNDEFNNDLVADLDALRALPGVTEATARLIVATVFGGAPPVSAGTLRVAERVAGISRNGSLNGVSQVVLSRLAGFGTDPTTNGLLLEIGRKLCRPEDPACDACPLASTCAYAAGYEDKSEEKTESAVGGLAVNEDTA